MIKLDILSDPVCPWCYIGKANLDRALGAAPDHPFAVEWHPFQLNPDMPAGGVDRRSYLEEKFGGRENAAAIYARIEQAAEAAGLKLDFSKIERTPNTLDAHRLIHWAGLEGVQTAAVSRLFKAYFEDGRDIGDRAVLLDIADGLNLDREMMERLFDSDADADDIRARDAHARRSGVTGVPTFVVGERHVLPGAQPVETWAGIIEELRQAVATPEHRDA